MAITTQSVDFIASSSEGMAVSGADFGAISATKFSYYCRFKLSSDGAVVRPIFRQQAVGGFSLSLLFGLTAADQLDFFISDNGSATEGRLTTNATFTSTTDWVGVLVHWDQANATAGDRMKMWVGVDGAEMTEVTSFATDTNPTDAMFNSAAAWRYGYNGPNTQNFDGKVYDGAFFDGVLVPHTDIEDRGAPKDITGISGLQSHLNVDGGTVNNDGVLVANWTLVSTPTASSDYPAFGHAETAGTSTAAATGAVEFAGVASSTGTSVAAGVGVAAAQSIGAAAGTSVVSAVGIVDFAGVGNSSGLSTVSAIGISNAQATGASSGIATVLGVGSSTGGSNLTELGLKIETTILSNALDTSIVKELELVTSIIC